MPKSKAFIPFRELCSPTGFTPFTPLEMRFLTGLRNRRFLTGFTLIELLIVITIIGILAGITMSGVTGARSRALDADIKVIVANEMVLAEMWHSDEATYQGFQVSRELPLCAKSLTPACRPEAKNVSDVQAVGTDNIAIFAPLCAQTGSCWCLDARGAAKTITSYPTLGTCP